MDRLRPAVTTMCIAVERFGGTVIRTLGDGLMALFGVPKSLEGHATLACEAALHMQAQFAGNPQGLSIRVGLHSGRVASDPHAADSSRGGGAHGLTIHLASRVIAMAPPGQITITADCHALVGSGCQVQSLGFPPLKGIPGRVEIMLLKGLDRDERGNRRLRQANLTPLRGRETEIAALEAREREARQGRGNAVGITGAPGTGKSRLCFEFAQHCRGRGVPVFEVHAQLYGHAMPLQPALELLRVFFFQLPPGADPAAARHLVSNRLDAVGLRDEADAALVHEFLGLAGDASPVAHLNPQAKRARLLLIVRHLVEQMGSAHAILIVEDLHWLDDASEEFVSVLVDALAGTRILLLVNYRPSYRSPWGQTPHYEEMELGELSAADMDALVAQLLAPISTAPEVRQLVCRRAAGNPFFAEELVRTLGESKLLEPSGVPAGGLEAIEKALPATVQAVVGARLDRVGEPEKTLLQMCAIIGKDIPLAVLEHVAAPLAEQIEKGLAGLGRAGLIVLADDGRSFSFRHPLIQEVAYNTQLKVRRSQVHSDVALAMEAYYREQLDEFAGLIAYHYEAAGRKTEAARYTSRAAKWVGSTNAALAIRHWHKVRALLEQDADSAANGGLKLMANSKIAWLGWRQGLTFDEVKPYIDEAMALAESAGSRWAQLLLMVEGRILQAGGASADLYVERVETALSLFDQASDPGRTATLNAALSQAYGWAGRLQEALAANDIALAGIGRIHKDDLDFVGFSIEQWVMAMRGRLLTRLGRFEEALECLDRLLEIAGTSIDPVIVQMPHYGYVELAAQLGDDKLAKWHLAKAAAIADKHPSPYLRVFALNGEALLHAMQLEHAQAARVLGEALALVRDANVAKEFETEILANLAESHRCAGNPDLALAHSKEAVGLSRERSNRLPECRGLITWGRVLAAHPRLGPRGEAETLLAQARSLIQATGASCYEDGLFPPGPFKGSLAAAA